MKFKLPSVSLCSLHYQRYTEIRIHKCKRKLHPRRDHEGPEGEQMYSSTLPSTSALDGVVGQRDAPAALPPGKTRYPLYRRLGGSQDRPGRVRNISPAAGFNPRTVQPVATELSRSQFSFIREVKENASVR